MILICLILIFIILYNLLQPCFCHKEGLEDYDNTFSTHLDVDNMLLSMKHPDHTDADPSMVEILEGNTDTAITTTDTSFTTLNFHRIENQKYYANNEITNDFKYFNNATSLLHFNEDNSGCTDSDGVCGPSNEYFLPLQNNDPDLSFERMFARLTDENDALVNDIMDDISNNKLEQEFYEKYLDNRFVKWHQGLSEMVSKISKEGVPELFRDYESERYKSNFYLKETQFNSDLVYYFSEYKKINNAIMFINEYMQYVNNAYNGVVGNLPLEQSLIYSVTKFGGIDITTVSTVTEDCGFDQLSETRDGDCVAYVKENCPQINSAEYCSEEYNATHLINQNFDDISLNTNGLLKEISYDNDESLNVKFKTMMETTIKDVLYNLSYVKTEIDKMKMDKIKVISTGNEDTERLKKETLYEPTGFYSRKYFESNLYDDDVSGVSADFKWFNNSSAIFAGYLKYNKVQ